MLDPVSVVITCYNLEPYIGAAIESVLAQNETDSLDIVVVDDCSTDASAEIIAGYPGIRLLRTPRNLGVLLATVLGMRSANGDIVAFLDGDDIWHPDKIRSVCDRFFLNPRLGLLTHDLRYVDSQGNAIDRITRCHRVMDGHTSQDFDRLVRDGILEHSDHVWLGSAYTIRKSAIDADGFCAWAELLPDPANTYQDWPLAYWAALSSHADMGYISKVLFDYRLHQANHSGDVRSPEKAARNVRRTYNTMHAIHDLIDRDDRPLLQARRATARKLTYADYLQDLYSSGGVASISKYIDSQPYIFDNGLGVLREFLRFAGVMVLGLPRFLRLTAILRGQR